MGNNDIFIIYDISVARFTKLAGLYIIGNFGQLACQAHNPNDLSLCVSNTHT